MMRVISMVPSLTETLLAAPEEVQVVGRTRFCVHPEPQVQRLPAVGGTKDIDWSKVATLKPDLMIFDQEENPKAFAEQCPVSWISTHVRDARTLAEDLKKLGEKLSSSKLLSFSERWSRVALAPSASWSFSRIPGEIERLALNPKAEFNKLVYVIWRDPWMAVSAETFIGSTLKALGAESLLPKFAKPYPEFLLEDFDLAKTYFLFSSEPYPFTKKKNDLLSLGLAGASLVDGESYSWFGLRTLRFLEAELGLGVIAER
jgi:ABC-type Fe3+-hydroxamate transport system substrate-binding protein